MIICGPYYNTLFNLFKIDVILLPGPFLRSFPLLNISVLIKPVSVIVHLLVHLTKTLLDIPRSPVNGNDEIKDELV